MKKSLLFAAVLGCVICSCEKPEPDVDGGGSTAVDKVALSPKSYTFKAEESTLAVVVESSAEWTLTPAEYEWIKPDVTKGKNGDKITFTASVNTEKTKRGPVTFTLTVGKATATFRAEQEAAKEDEPGPGPGVEFELQDPAQKDLSYEVGGGSAMVSIKTALKAADITVTLSEGASWVTTQKADNPQTNLPVVGIVVPKNEGAARTATVTLSAEGANDIVINVSQAGTAPQPGETLITTAGKFTSTRAYPTWEGDASAFVDMEELTFEALVYHEGGWNSLNTIAGIDGYFMIRTGDDGIQKNQLQIATSGDDAGSSETKLNSDVYLEENTWYHIAVTFNKGELKLYVNGEEKGNITAPATTKRTLNREHTDETGGWGATRCFWVGYSCGASRCWKGMMSEVRIWNKALTSAEINAANHFYTVPANSNGLVAYWKFNEGEGATVKDQTSNGNHLYCQINVKNDPPTTATGESGMEWASVSLPE